MDGIIAHEMVYRVTYVQCMVWRGQSPLGQQSLSSDTFYQPNSFSDRKTQCYQGYTPLFITENLYTGPLTIVRCISWIFILNLKQL